MVLICMRGPPAGAPLKVALLASWPQTGDLGASGGAGSTAGLAACSVAAWHTALPSGSTVHILRVEQVSMSRSACLCLALLLLPLLHVHVPCCTCQSSACVAYAHSSGSGVGSSASIGHVAWPLLLKALCLSWAKCVQQL